LVFLLNKVRQMKRYKISHNSFCNFSGAVHLLPHTLRLRPREGQGLRIESTILDISPRAMVHWQSDPDGNTVALATFNTSTCKLMIKSEIIVQQYELSPREFFTSDHYVSDIPIEYDEKEKKILDPYINELNYCEHPAVKDWTKHLWSTEENIKCYTLLQRLNQLTFQTLSYKQREGETLQSAQVTLSQGSGSSSDFANLFMIAARHLGFAARFVTGYIHPPNVTPIFGATHSWAEVFIPKAGWKGFDPTTGKIVEEDHIATSVTRLAESALPISGNFIGSPGTSINVAVKVTELPTLEPSN